MHDVQVKLKNGEVISGPMFTWRPVEGWFELAGDMRRIMLRDVESAVGTDRTHIPRYDCQRCAAECSGIEQIDYLEQARDEGWRQET